MTPEEKATYVRYRLERAQETLVEARLLVDKDLFSGAINRIYYAMFYAILALLVPVLTYTMFQITQIDENEQLIQSIYYRHL